MDTQGWFNEMQGIREMISKFAHIDESEIIGKLFLRYYFITTWLSLAIANLLQHDFIE